MSTNNGVSTAGLSKGKQPQVSGMTNIPPGYWKNASGVTNAVFFSISSPLYSPGSLNMVSAHPLQRIGSLPMPHEAAGTPSNPVIVK